mmetsp:Transcript_7245/g.12020  ORF Transcript_7245/g.12020 Transcript_7245/m.12020 type:complete len:108 (-) Transcript_7245:48-371(-)
MEIQIDSSLNHHFCPKPDKQDEHWKEVFNFTTKMKEVDKEIKYEVDCLADCDDTNDFVEELLGYAGSNMSMKTEMPKPTSPKESVDAAVADSPPDGNSDDDDDTCNF